MRRFVLLLFILLAYSNFSCANEITARKLTLTYSVNRQVCREAAILLKEDKLCRPYDFVDRSNPNMCSPEEVDFINIHGSPTLTFKEIATNEYGYTQVYTTPVVIIDGYTIIYLEQFNGDKYPRTVETWKVDAKAMNEVFSLAPGPIPSKKDGKATHPKDTRAAEFAEVLKQGEKLSDDWSPIIELNGSQYFAERECSGDWKYGGIYACNKVIKLTLKKIIPSRRVVAYCQFTRAKNK